MWSYLKSREFKLTALAILGGGMLLFVLFFFVFLPLYTNHGEAVLVPDLSRMTLDNAIETLEDKGLRYEVVDSLYNSDLEPLAVISQDPVKRSKVKPGRRIYLTVNKTVAPRVRVPKVVGVSAYQAKLRLEGANLQVGRQEYVPHQYANLVIAVAYKGRKINEGDEIPKFAKLDLVIGQGMGNAKVLMPDLVGVPVDQAIAMLNRLGLSFAPPRWTPGAPGEQGQVYQQNPKYLEGDSVNAGTEFVLFVSGEEPPEALEGYGGDQDTTR
jgi:beta-lactam-binding protein with PASTA domain